MAELSSRERKAAFLGFAGIIGSAALAEAVFTASRSGGVFTMKEGPQREDRWDESLAVFAVLLGALALTGVAYGELADEYGTERVVQGSVAFSGIALALAAIRNR